MTGGTAPGQLGAVRGALRRRPGAPRGRGVHPAPSGDRAPPGRVPAQPAAADPAHPGRCGGPSRRPSAARLLDLGVNLPGAAHAAEHASIGLLPLFAACDRWDVGGVSADLHPATGQLTVFVYDGHDGGAGFAERGYHAAREWLGATADAIRSCECQAGCPSCIQSPKCGNGNEPLSKPGSVTLLEWPTGQRRRRAGQPAAHREAGGHIRKIGPGPGRICGQCAGKGATPAGGESGGRQTVRLRGGRAGPVGPKAYVYPGQVTNRSRHADTTKTCFRP